MHRSNQAKALAELMARFIDRGEYLLAIEAGQAAVAECHILRGPVIPQDTGMAGSAK